MDVHKSPAFNEGDFNCPHCGIRTHHIWISHSRGYETPINSTSCYICKEPTIWYKERMIYPLTGSAPVPNPELPDDIKADYLEARSIAAISPRGAAALLRLAIDKLTNHLGATGRTIDDRIRDLVAKGLDLRVQQMLDSVRVIGNETVHPGQIDLRDDPELAGTLFWLVNEITSEMITKPQRIAAIYQRLPENKRKEIERNDKRQAKQETSA